MKTPIEYIKEAWKIYTKKENFIFFSKIMSILVLVSILVGFVTGYFYPSDYLKNADFSNIPRLAGFIAVSLAAIIVGLWTQTVTYFSILKVENTPAGGEKDILKLGFKKMGKFLLISLTLGIIITFGAILLIIPAIIFGTWYSFSTLLVLDKNMGIKDALKTSKSMVKGKFWKILGRSVAFSLFTFLVSFGLSMIPYVGDFALSFVAPLFLLPFYLLYRDLSVTD